MSLSLQNLIVLFAVTGCGWVLLRHAVGAFTGKRSKVGSCCAEGCPCSVPRDSEVPAAAKPQTAFVPVESLRSCCRPK